MSLLKPPHLLGETPLTCNDTKNMAIEVDQITAPGDQPRPQYGKTYMDWKGWGEQNFAQPEQLTRCYFDAELTRARFEQRGHAKVLEIGFGNGGFLAYAKEKGWDITGTEVNCDLIDLANRLGYQAIHARDLDQVEAASFDLVVAFDVLEHIAPTHLLDFVNSITRPLKVGGVLLARFPNGDSPFGLINQNGDLTHRTALGRGIVHYLAEELNLGLVFFGAQAVPLGCGSALRSVRRFFWLAFTKTIDRIVNTLFYPNSHIAFCASNAVMAVRVKGAGVDKQDIRS